MKKFKKIIKWTAIVLVVLIAGISTITATRQHATFEAAYPAIKATTDSAVIARGKHLVFDIAHCADCHSNTNSDSLLKLGLDVPLSGGFRFALPVGDIYSKNITPDSVNGIGRYTDEEVARVLRYGVHPTGTAVFDFMPFHNMSDEDLRAVISYLRVQKPVSNPVPDHKLNVMGNLVKAFMVKPVGPDGAVETAVKPDTTATYGRYLAMSVANCSGCHTLRGLTGGFIGEPFAGGAIENMKTPNLTPDSSSRIFGWSQANFIARFRMGKLVPGTPMPWNSFKRMSDDELKAIYNYLQTVKPAKTTVIKE
ncbi:MAG: cytochrome c [Bacteroidota bacterium]|nr:cytochrome c [Ferruginibacter sp.]